LLKRPTQLDERIPVEVGVIQVNFCKNPQCQNFGVPASTKRHPRGRGAVERGWETYSLVGTGKGQDNSRGYCLLSAAKLNAIVHYACWGRYLPQKKDCRLSISSPFSHFFNTLSDRLVLSLPAFLVAMVSLMRRRRCTLNTRMNRAELSG